MLKGFFGTAVSYLIFIILPFAYLLTSVYTLVTNETRLAANTDAEQGKHVTQVYQA